MGLCCLESPRFVRLQALGKLSGVYARVSVSSVYSSACTCVPKSTSISTHACMHVVHAWHILRIRHVGVLAATLPHSQPQRLLLLRTNLNYRILVNSACSLNPHFSSPAKYR